MSKIWWDKKPKQVNVIVDNDSWVIPYAERLVEAINNNRDTAIFCGSYDVVQAADVSFYLGCIKIAPEVVLNKSRKNLVVHESDLPKGKGFSPLIWQILEGFNCIPICLIEMVEKVDSGAIVFKDKLFFKGHELIDELRQAQGEKTIELCLRYITSPTEPVGCNQIGEETFYKKRKPENSILDINKSILENFNLLRVVDNEKYPAFFEINGCKYVIQINKVKR